MKKINLTNLILGVLMGGLIPSTGNSQEKLYQDQFPLRDVSLLDGPFKQARDLNLKVLLQYDVDRLLAPYRKEAGLPKKAETYPNWDGLDGHVGGHYLSALAMNYAATGSAECKKRMEYMINELRECQEANAKNNAQWGTGYVGGFPNSARLWSAFKKGDLSIYNSAWAPFYNLHKMYAGLRDAWLYADNKEAKDMFLKFCDWGIDITAGLSDEQMERMLNMEHGGMNEMFADAYQMTKDNKYLAAAKRYSHRQFLDPLSKGVDNLDNKHANTQIPKFIGFGRVGELSGDEQYAKAARFSWETITQNRSLAFGGNSRREHFPSKTSAFDYLLVTDGPETCNTYNMLKLTEDLFREQPEAKYMDYYERATFNHIRSTQHPEHGGYVYFTSARPRQHRKYSAPNKAMWCCVGTGMENHGKYNQMVFSHSGDKLFLNLFMASQLSWREKGVEIKQETNFPLEEQTKLTVTKGKAKFNLLVRYPGWVKEGDLKIMINGKAFNYSAKPSSYVSIDREWKKGDRVELTLPMRNTVERMPDVPDYVAIMHGPILLGAKAGTEDMGSLVAGEGRFDQYTGGKMLPIDKAPIIIDNNIENIADKLVPVEGKPLHFTLNVATKNPLENMVLEPFYQIHDARYMIYWLALNDSRYERYSDSLSKTEEKRLALDRRTVDKVNTGEQQPETDHKMQSKNSRTGNNFDEMFREAGNEGYFSYDMVTNSETDLKLYVRYWGAEWGTRKFDIYIDDKKLITEDNTDRWNQSQFQDVEYSIPNAMLKGKENIRVKFQALPNSTAGAVYYVRLVREK